MNESFQNESTLSSPLDLMEIIPPLHRYQVKILGRVQGVGFRPFLYRLATEMGIRGWVRNDLQGVTCTIEGSKDLLQAFLNRLETSPPKAASIRSISWQSKAPQGETGFAIVDSDETTDSIPPSLQESGTMQIPSPDLAPCSGCLRELWDPNDRRYLYPFIHCTQCGPRYSIIEKIPYDRAHTTMRHFSPCEKCQEEYFSPLDRRFHAETNACPDCGPQLALWDREGMVIAEKSDVLSKTIEALQRNQVVAVKGVGGFHLMARASSPEAIAKLRSLKQRATKPFAVLYPDLKAIEVDCELSAIDRKLLTSPEGPIVLVHRKRTASVGQTSRVGNPLHDRAARIDDGVAPRNPFLGVFLPANPLHELISRSMNEPLIATSGNLAEEPIITDETTALKRLNQVADYFLVHNRRIAHFVDDSLVRTIHEEPLFLRRSRGYSPFTLSFKTSQPTLAVGGHLKNSTAMASGDSLFVSPHIGDLSTAAAREAWRVSVTQWESTLSRPVSTIATDCHPNYASTIEANRLFPSLTEGQHHYPHNQVKNYYTHIRVQHHYAHILSCLVDNQTDSDVLGIAWDGSGDGDDGTIWGGEFLKVSKKGYSRVASFLPFFLPGGEKAIREGRRTALALLYEVKDSLPSFEERVARLGFSHHETKILLQLMKEKQSPKTSSVGRLFDAFAAIFGICPCSTFEGEAASLVEFSAMNSPCVTPYPYKLLPLDTLRIDWRPMLISAISDDSQGIPTPDIMAKFHHTLVAIASEVAYFCKEKTIAISGGVFQNKLLSECLIRKLESENFKVLRHKEIPPNDGGLAVGQIAAVSRALTKTLKMAQVE